MPLADLSQIFGDKVKAYCDAIAWQDSPEGVIAYRAARTPKGDIQTHWIMAEGSGTAVVPAPIYQDPFWIPAGEALVVSVPWREYM